MTAGCTQCSIEFSTVARLEDPEGAIADLPYSVMEFGRSLLVVGARAPLQRLPAAFDSRGQFQRVIGQIGPGPGEIAIPVWTARLAGDTMRVFMIGRYSDFTVRGDHVRSGALRGGPGFVNSMVLFPSGVNVVSPAARIPAVDRDESPIVVREADGTVRRTLGLLDTRGQPVRRVLGPAKLGGTEAFWVAHSGTALPQGYAVMLVGTDGRVRRNIRHDPTWWEFAPPVARGGQWVRSRPISAVAAVHERDDGTLLVLLEHPRSDWRTVAEGDFRYEHRLVAIDLRTLAVVATGTIAARSVHIVSDSRLVTYDETEDGDPRLSIVEFRLPR